MHKSQKIWFGIFQKPNQLGSISYSVFQKIRKKKLLRERMYFDKTDLIWYKPRLV